MPDKTQIHDEQAFEYFAFVSYSRKDEKWAKRVQQELEKYRLPMALYKEESTLPKKIRPVFRDVTDLSAGQLQKELHRQLENSNKLIVICSPSSARSEWVNKEIAHFIDRRGYENVIPLIVEGTPYGGEDECFPKVLRLEQDKELLGIGVKELGWRNAFLRVVSGLLNVKYDSLKRRHEQRRKRLSIITSVVVALFLLLSGVVSYNAWDYFVPHEAYYADYILRWGVPEGIGPLNKEELSTRSEHYVITTHMRRVVRLVHANAAGMAIPHMDTERLNRPMIARYTYSEDGRIRTAEYLDKRDKVLLAQNYTSDLKAVDFSVSGDNSAFITLAASGSSMRAGMLGLNAIGGGASGMRSDITRYALEYDERGYVTKEVFMRDNRQTPVLDAEGIGGLEYVLDALGRPIETRYLGYNGEAYAVTRHNVAGRKLTYDDAGCLIREEYVDPSGQPVLNEMGWMIIECEYDKNGNTLRQSCLDEDGKPMASYEGYAMIAYEYDISGYLIMGTFLDESGAPFVNDYGFSSTQMRYDERGNMTWWSAFGPDQRPVLTEYGYASVMRAYDEYDQVLLESYYDADNNPVSMYGYFMVAISYDDLGNESRIDFLDKDKQPVIGSMGYASIEQYYNERGLRVATAFLGTDGLPIINSYGYATDRLEYDERGNVVKESYFGVDGAPIIIKEGYASVAFEYDERGNITRSSYLGTDDRLIMSIYGYAELRWDWDERGNVIRESILDAEGLPAINSYGYATQEIIYDEGGVIIDECFYDAQGMPVYLD